MPLNQNGTKLPDSKEWRVRGFTWALNQKGTGSALMSEGTSSLSRFSLKRMLRSALTQDFGIYHFSRGVERELDHAAGRILDPTYGLSRCVSGFSQNSKAGNVAEASKFSRVNRRSSIFSSNVSSAFVRITELRSAVSGASFGLAVCPTTKRE